MKTYSWGTEGLTEGSEGLHGLFIRLVAVISSTFIFRTPVWSDKF